MATIRLEQRGTALVAKNNRLVVTVNRPRVKAIYDQCGIIDYVKTSGSYAISGRPTCESRMVDIARLSYSYLQKAPAVTDAANDIAFANIRATSNVFVETPFGGANAPPGAATEISKVQAFYLLNDQCDIPIGNIEDTNFNRYVFDQTNCRLAILTSLNTSLAVNDDLGGNITDIHGVLGGFFEETNKAGGLQAPTTAAWLALANNNITLGIPGMDSVNVNLPG